MTTRVRICECSLRDGSNAVQHQLTPENAESIARRLDEIGVYAIEVGHGDGLAASSMHYGVGAHSDTALIGAAAGSIERAELAVSVQPGIATTDDMRAAHEAGAGSFKIATHCTEADIALQHLAFAHSIGGKAVGGLMMTHLVEPPLLVENALVMADAGAETVYVADSAGALTMDGIRARVASIRAKLPQSVAVGIHAHNNFGLGVGNTIAAIEEGAEVVDACLAGFGAGAGNCQLEALVAVLDRLGVEHGVDLWKALDAADECVRPIMTTPPVVDATTITLGFAGIYSSFLSHVQDAAHRYGVEPRDILVELGRRKVVAGQEDAILDVAAGLAERQREAVR